MSRQFLYLLVMNSFLSSNPPVESSLTSSSQNSSNDKTILATTSAMVTTTEMLSNQLSNWLSQISNDFDIGFVYRPEIKNLNAPEQITSQEVQVALSTQLFNDKVLINSNFDVPTAGKNTNQIPDIDIEYKITEKIKFKVFNRFNNLYTGKGDYTQGFGFFFKQDFDKFSDLFRKRVKSEMKKEEAPTITEN